MLIEWSAIAQDGHFLHRVDNPRHHIAKITVLQINC